jgi:hypothetical protein
LPQQAPRSLQLAIIVAGFAVLGAAGSAMISTAQLVAVPTTLFLSVYLACTAATARIFVGSTRVIAAIAGLTVLGVLAFSGWALIVTSLVVLGALVVRDPVADRGPDHGQAVRRHCVWRSSSIPRSVWARTAVARLRLGRDSEEHGSDDRETGEGQ